MKSKPYLGVLGVTCEEEIKESNLAFRQNGFSLETRVIPMLGFLVKRKGKETQNDYLDKLKGYVSLSKVGELLSSARKESFATICYSSENQNGLLSELEGIFYETGVPDGIQIGGEIPLASQVRSLREKYSDLKIIYRANLKTLLNTPEEIASRFKSCEGFFDYVLINPSWVLGNGTRFFNAAEALRLIRDGEEDLQVGFYGGINGDNVSRIISELIFLGAEEFSLDAEIGQRGDFGFDWGRVEKYISNSKEMNESF